MKFAIRRDVLNLPLEQWRIADSLNLESITPTEWISAIGGKGGFLTAKLNEQEQEFVRQVYQDQP